MVVTESEYFPRGGKKIVSTPGQNKRKLEDNIFNLDTHQKPKKARKQKPDGGAVSNSEGWQLALNLKGTLTYNKIQEGMVILCCIRHISNLAVQVEFPGLTYGFVTINQISDTFNQRLSKQLETENDESFRSVLKNIIKVGHLVPAQILSVKKTDNGHEVQASLNPENINSGKKHSSFKKGQMVWGNVVSKLDHGYELTLGVNNCRVFMPFEKTETHEYEIGQPLYVVIHKVNTSDLATTLTVSGKQEHIDKFQPEDLTLNDILPGMKIQLAIEELNPKGIKGQFFENCYGYIDETQVFPNISTKKLKEGQTTAAYVLFVEPITKITYLTLQGLADLPEPQLELGKIISAKVVSDVSGGLYLQLGKTTARGFVTNKRLLNTLSKGAQTDVIQTIRKKYPVDSHHECRILDYNYMQQIYICTFEKQLVTEKVFSVKDLQLGQLVKVTVDQVIPNGLVVKTGHIQGFVPNLHLSNVEYSENIKSKFSVGMTVDARVLNITSDGNVLFTLKQGLVSAENCLSKKENALPNSQHVGFIVHTKISGALVAFYGRVKGWISNKTLNLGHSGRYLDPREYFFMGQVVTVWILGFKNNKLQLSLIPPLPKTSKLIHVGDKSSGTVVRTHSEGVDVVGKNNVEATVPLAHLSSNLLLCPILKNVYEPGDEMPELMCVNNTSTPPIMSRREAKAYKKKSLKVCKLRQLGKKKTLRCSFEGSDDSGMYVTAPIKDYQEKIFIPVENFPKKGTVSLNFEKQECVLTKVGNVDLDTKKIDLFVVKENESKKPNIMLDNFIETLEEIENVIQLYNKKDMKLTAYKIGDRVQCNIKLHNENGDCLVTLPNGAEGIIRKEVRSANCTTRIVIEGIVLDYNFVENVVELCARNNLKHRINKVQDGLIKKSFFSSCVAKILLVTKFYAIGILDDKHYNRQLFYLPLCFTEGGNSLYKKKMKIVAYRRVGSKIIGLPKKFCEKKLGKLNKNKQQLKNKEEENVEIESEDEDEVSSSNNLGKVSKKSELENQEEESVDIESEVDSDSSLKEISKTSKQKKLKKKQKLKEQLKHETDDNNIDSSSDSEGPNETNINENIENMEEISSTDENIEDKNTIKINKNEKVVISQNDKTTSESILSGTQSFYIMSNMNKFGDESSSDDEDVEKEQNKKKKKLSAAERAEAAKKEEERISKIEKQLADTETTPQTAEQFDRLLLANPNSSELWLKYISMHVAATELDKARAVGRKAIETINMTLVKEKFNIWIALLNLENMYGTKESFEKLFEEAVRYNDFLEIYLSVIQLLATSGKFSEMEEKIKRVRSKEKQNVKMWLEIGRVYYSLKKFKEARNVKDAALKSILDKKRQFDIIMRFGIMEFQLGELEQAIANFETILNTFPSKVNIWTIYVDQLVKQNKIDLARKILDRATNEKFNVKTIKVLFKKFISFEEQYGNPESVESVRIKAQDYIKSLK